MENSPAGLGHDGNPCPDWGWSWRKDPFRRPRSQGASWLSRRNRKTHHCANPFGSRIMKLKYIGVTCLAILACSDGTESRRLGDGSSGERIAREVVYDTLWTYGGPDDTLLAAPIRMAAAPMGGVYVLDAGMRKVYHFADGRLVWWAQVPGRFLMSVRWTRILKQAELFWWIVATDASSCCQPTAHCFVRRRSKLLHRCFPPSRRWGVDSATSSVLIRSRFH